MPRQDNENQYIYGPYDYRTAEEDRQRDQADRDKEAMERAHQNMLDTQERLRRQAEEDRQRQERENQRQRDAAKRQAEKKSAKKSAAKPGKQTAKEAESGFMNALIMLTGAGIGAYLAIQNQQELEGLLFSAFMGTCIAYALRNLIKGLLTLAVIVVAGIFAFTFLSKAGVF